MKVNAVDKVPSTQEWQVHVERDDETITAVHSDGSNCILHKVASACDIVDDENSPLLASQSSFASYSESENHFGDSRRIRKPFHYRLRPQNTAVAVNTAASEVTVRGDSLATFHRLKYYNRLTSPTDGTLRIPDHVVPSAFFYGIPNPIPTKVVGNQSSLVTIFVIWNTMVGTSLLSMPWAVSQAGLPLGMFLMVFMATICFYTAYRILCVQKYVVGSAGDNADFSVLCRILLGRWGSTASIFFSLCTLLGATIVCYILSTNFLYYVVFYVYDIFAELPRPPLMDNQTHSNVICPNAVPSAANFTSSFVNDSAIYSQTSDLFPRIWDLRLTVPLLMVFILGPLVNVRSPDFFAKFSALGTLSVVFLMIFVATKAITWGVHVDFVDTSDADYVPQFKSSFFALTGTLALSLFVHNCILSIVHNQRKPENNTRDLAIAFVLVTSTYMFIGGMFYATFPLTKDCIADNMLDNLDGRDPMAFLVRIFLFFQVLTVCPLLFYIFRIQFMYHLFGSIYPGCKHVFILNLTLISTGVLFAIFMPSIGTIIRFVGAFCGLAYAFVLPCLTYVTALTEQQQLSKFSIAIHAVIVLLGVINLIAQFVYV